MPSLDELRKLILNANDLNEPLNYFFDLIDNKVIHSNKNHKPIRQLRTFDELHEVVNAVELLLSHRLNKEVQIASHDFYQIARNHFYHGICTSQAIPFPLTVIYFSDIQTGLFAITSVEYQTDIYRFILAKHSTLRSIH